MEFYIVKLRRMQEFENIYEAANADEAVELARLEAVHGGIVLDEWADVDLVEELDARETN